MEFLASYQRLYLQNAALEKHSAAVNYNFIPFMLFAI